MRYLTLAEVLELHRRVIDQSGGAGGVRDLGGLESAVVQAQMVIGDTKLYPSVEEAAAAVCYSLVMNHAFVDGNKRIGHAAMETFLVCRKGRGDCEQLQWRYFRQPLSTAVNDNPCEDIELLPLPKDWSKAARHAVLNVIGIARIAMLAGREALINNGDAKLAKVHQLELEIAMLREELRINSARTKRVDPRRRPQYTAIERMAVLQLRAMRGWNKAETARHFFVSDDTIRAWLRRVDDNLLVQTRTPVNRFPDFVRYTIQQIT